MAERKAHQSSTADRSERRCGFVALVGAPNAGKSTLTNRLVGTKVSIVTHKAQTTRVRIRAIAIEGQAQIILVDTPGIFEPKRRLDRAMVGSAREEAKDADIVVLLIDAAKGLDENAKTAIKVLTDLRIQLVLCLNKIDRLRKEALLELTKELTGEADFGDVDQIVERLEDDRELIKVGSILLWNDRALPGELLAGREHVLVEGAERLARDGDGVVDLDPDVADP